MAFWLGKNKSQCDLARLSLELKIFSYTLNYNRKTILIKD